MTTTEALLKARDEAGEKARMAEWTLIGAAQAVVVNQRKGGGAHLLPHLLHFLDQAFTAHIKAQDDHLALCEAVVAAYDAQLGRTPAVQS